MFKICWFLFDQSKCYEYALATRIDYINRKYYTTNPLRYLGNFVSYDIKTIDCVKREIYFNDNGIENVIEIDYDGRDCFREMSF